MLAYLHKVKYQYSHPMESHWNYKEEEGGSKPQIFKEKYEGDGGS